MLIIDNEIPLQILFSVRSPKRAKPDDLPAKRTQPRLRGCATNRN